MKFLYILPALLLSGCFYQTANLYDIKRAIKSCGSIDNIVKLEIWALGDESVRCLDPTKNKSENEFSHMSAE